MKKQITLLTMTFLLALTSCNSVPESPSDATYTQLIQMGQDSLEIPNYRAAEAYYTAAIQRFGMNSTVYVEATYEEYKGDIKSIDAKKERYKYHSLKPINGRYDLLDFLLL